MPTRTLLTGAALTAVLVTSLVGPAAAASVPLTPPAGSVTASTSNDNEPGNVVDGDFGTRWSGEGDGAWLQLDLGAVATVSHIKLAVYKGDRRRNDFELQVGDGNTWTTVYDGSSGGETTGLQTFDFADLQGSKVRYVGHGHTLNTDGSHGSWNSLTEVEVWGTGGGDTPGGDHPGDPLDLTNWKLTLPTGSQGHPTEIKQPALDDYSDDRYFTVAGTAVRFRAPVDGVTTSGSSYPRSELREMTSNGTENASWSSTSGTHTLIVDEAFTRLPADKPHMVGAQIHDSDDDVMVFRLEGSKLYLTNGDTTHYKLVTGDYVLGTRYEAKFVVSDGRIEAYYNGVLQATVDKSFSGAYFKAGAYTQANCSNSSPCDSGNFGEVEIHSITVQHS